MRPGRLGPGRQQLGGTISQLILGFNEAGAIRPRKA